MNLSFNLRKLHRSPHSIVVVRGAGDLATGIIVRLKKAGFCVIALECECPTSIRRTVSLSEAVYDGEKEVEGIKAVLVHNFSDAISLSSIRGVVPLLVDENAQSVRRIRPLVLVDAIMAKRNLGTTINDAKVVIGVGPGFTASVDCHAFIETMRGHYLGGVIKNGSAEPNTGIPGLVGGFASERVIHSPTSGIIKGITNIGESVEKDSVIALVDDVEVKSPISGTLRGLIRSGLFVKEGMKIADVDPRNVREYITTCSDKAKAIAGGVLEAVLSSIPWTIVESEGDREV